MAVYLVWVLSLLQFHLNDAARQQTTIATGDGGAGEKGACFRGTALVAATNNTEKTAAYSPSTQKIITVPLLAQYGSHHVVVQVGSSPQQQQTLILDTGSRYTAFPCEPWCNNQTKNCGNHHATKYFNATQSTTISEAESPDCIFAEVNNSGACIFSQKYVEGSSWTAVEVKDMFWFDRNDDDNGNNQISAPVPFGCQTFVNGSFARQYADGILGMGRSLDGNDNAILTALMEAKAIGRKTFATCLTRKGGTLSLGGRTTTVVPMEPLKFTDIIQDHGLYSVRVAKVYVGDICITCDDDDTVRHGQERLQRRRALEAFRGGNGILLDSGTTDTFFPKHAYPVFAPVWKALTGFDKIEETRKYTYREFRRIPDVTLVLEPNTTLVIPASAYMQGVPIDTNASFPEAVRPWMGTKQLSMRLYMEEKSGAVLGANAMYNYDILYDLEENKIGFARAHCGA